MQLKVLSALVVICLVAARCEGNIDPNSPNDPNTSNEGSTASSFSADVTASLQNLLGLNCIAEAVLNLEDEIGDLQYSVQLCGVNLPVDASFVMSDCSDLAQTTSAILNANDNICNNGAYMASEDATKRPTASCVANIKRQMERLSAATAAISGEISALNGNSACVTIAMENFKLTLSNMGALVATCGKLATQAEQ